MDCANCAAKVENAISKLDDVENVSISFMTTKMVLKADEDKMDAVIAESEKIIKKIRTGCSHEAKSIMKEGFLC